MSGQMKEREDNAGCAANGMMPTQSAKIAGPIRMVSAPSGLTVGTVESAILRETFGGAMSADYVKTAMNNLLSIACGAESTVKTFAKDVWLALIVRMI